jgi:hypothetical protein
MAIGYSNGNFDTKIEKQEWHYQWLEVWTIHITFSYYELTFPPIVIG